VSADHRRLAECTSDVHVRGLTEPSSVVILLCASYTRTNEAKSSAASNARAPAERGSPAGDVGSDVLRVVREYARLACVAGLAQ
jgi:hypothetical protein